MLNERKSFVGASSISWKENWALFSECTGCQRQGRAAIPTRRGCLSAISSVVVSLGQPAEAVGGFLSSASLTRRRPMGEQLDVPLSLARLCPRLGVQRERVPFRGSHLSANTAPPERNPGASEPALLTADDSVGAGGRHRVVHLFVSLEPGILESRGAKPLDFPPAVLNNVMDTTTQSQSTSETGIESQLLLDV